MVLLPVVKDGLPLVKDDGFGNLVPAVAEDACDCCGSPFPECCCSDCEGKRMYLTLAGFVGSVDGDDNACCAGGACELFNNTWISDPYAGGDAYLCSWITCWENLFPGSTCNNVSFYDLTVGMRSSLRAVAFGSYWSHFEIGATVFITDGTDINCDGCGIFAAVSGQISLPANTHPISSPPPCPSALDAISGTLAPPIDGFYPVNNEPDPSSPGNRRNCANGPWTIFNGCGQLYPCGYLDGVWQAPTWEIYFA